MFNSKDLKQFEFKNISTDQIVTQLKNFKRGFPYAELTAAATPAKGIKVLSDGEVETMVSVFNDHATGFRIVKMVPASGAASRMFKSLHAFMDGNENQTSGEVLEFIEKIRDFAFYEELKTVLEKDGLNIESCDPKITIEYLLTDKGLGYTSLPKGLLSFHNYPDGPRTPLEEHMVEGLHYSKDQDGQAHLHFTVSPEHKEKFIAKAASKEDQLASGSSGFNITYSIQKPSTDTLAVDGENNPFRERDGSILFRPGGHGALIENLNELDADIAFIKNIDNVVPDRLKEKTYTYKKVLGGMLIDLQEKTFELLEEVEDGNIDENTINTAKNELNIIFPDKWDGLDINDKLEFLRTKLNRPIRICGMVKNEGEPGGGPFWVKNSKGETSLQIVESSQINMEDPEQKQILSEATHFNPVDLVCSLKDHNGQAFDLKEFVDPQTGFISIKSKDGKELKAQELPGLWNGAMADWITVFVEVPIETFNPVKTVNDLLRPQHQ